MKTKTEAQPLAQLPTSELLSIERHSDLTNLWVANLFGQSLSVYYPELIRAKQPWLDIGCGTGNVSAGAAQGLINVEEYLPESVTLVDTYNHAQRSQERLNQLGVPTTFIQNDVFKLELTGSSFGFIFCFNLSEYFNTTYDTNGARANIILSQAADWLVPGGCLICAPLDDDSPIITMATEYGLNCVDRHGTYFFEKKME